MPATTPPHFETSLDRAVFRKSGMFGGIDLMSARFVQHSFSPHSHDDLMIGVIHAGVKAFQCGNARQYAAPGSVSVVNPGEIHTGQREYGAELAYGAIYVPQSALLRMAPDWAGACDAVGRPVIDDHDIWRYLAHAHGLAMTGHDPVAAEEAMTCGLSLLFGRFGARPPIGCEMACPQTVSRAVDFLETHACDHISLEDASGVAGVGSFQLIRLFKRHLGLTPHAYLTQTRIAKSRRLLLQGQPPSQIALDVGFADQAHFTKRFKQLTGTTPALYAKSMR